MIELEKKPETIKTLQEWAQELGSGHWLFNQYARDHRDYGDDFVAVFKNEKVIFSQYLDGSHYSVIGDNQTPWKGVLIGRLNYKLRDTGYTNQPVEDE